MITCKELRRLLCYDAKRGLFWRRVNRRRARAGELAGYMQRNGYWQIEINGKSYKSHRLAWLFIKGYFPENQVDHINRKPWDNRWKNLREASQSCNMRNTGNRCDNTSGVKGVYWHKATRRWRVQIVNGKVVCLGYFDDFTEAVAHRLAAEQCLKWSGCDSSSPAFKYMEKYIGNNIS